MKVHLEMPEASSYTRIKESDRTLWLSACVIDVSLSSSSNIQAHGATVGTFMWYGTRILLLHEFTKQA